MRENFRESLFIIHFRMPLRLIGDRLFMRFRLLGYMVGKYAPKNRFLRSMEVPTNPFALMYRSLS